MSVIVGTMYIPACAAVPVGKLPCAMGIMAYTAAAMQLGISGYSFATAGSLESDQETGSKDIFSSEKPLPTDDDFNKLPPIEPSEPDASSLSREAVLKNMDKLKAQIEDLKNRGILTDEIIANPEKLLTPDQLAEFNAEKEKLMAGLEEKNGDSSSEALEALLEDSANGGSESEGSQTAGFQTASLTSAFDSLNLEGLLGLKEKGIQNSAPGYYGNVSLKSLRPDSSMSLFERVSLKIKKALLVSR
ncbi:MAG: hypothetical protein AAB309_02225 [Deltaproteobacteria bacterium]